MDLATTVAAFTGLMALFFGVGFWGMQKSLLEGQQKHITNKNEQIDNLQKETRKLRGRIEDLEKHYFELTREKDQTSNMVDNYIAMVESLKIENERLLAENRKLKKRLDLLNPLPGK